MKRADLINWIESKGYVNNGRNSDRYIKTEDGINRKCFKLSSIAIRYEVESIHLATTYSPASRSWVRIKSGYISKVTINQDDKICGLKRQNQNRQTRKGKVIDMKCKEVYKAFQAYGLASVKNTEPYFSHNLCDNCNGLRGNRYEVEGYLSLNEAQNEVNKGDNLYTLELCEDCYVKLFS